MNPGYPRKINKLTVQRPVNVNRITVVVHEFEIKQMIRDKFKGVLIGPEELSLPDDFSIDVGMEEPCGITITFDIDDES